MEGFYRVLRLQNAFWVDLPGGGNFNQSWQAIRAATVYHEKSHAPTRVLNQHSATVWDSAVDLPHPANEKLIPFED